MKVYATPRVQREAEQLGVDLAKVSGTGAGGRITPADVRAAADPAVLAARRPARPAAAQPRAAATYGRPSVMQTYYSQFNRQLQVKVDAYSSTPLTDDLKQVRPEAFEAARTRPGAVMPGLFVAGELPLFVAAGFDPQMLLQLPWTIRHAVAATSDHSIVAEVFERCGGKDPSSVHLAYHLALNHPRLKDHTAHGWADYRKRVEAWEYPPPPPRVWKSYLVDGTTREFTA